MTRVSRLSLVFILCAPLFAGAQVMRCTDSTGKVQFSDRPCAEGQKAAEVKIYKDPVAKIEPSGRISSRAMAYEKERMRLSNESNERQKRIAETNQEVRKIKDDNADPRKCADARVRKSLMERDGSVKFSGSTDYFMIKQSVALYCGN